MSSKTILPASLTIEGSKLNGIIKFKCGNTVPIYLVNTVHALNQLIGHAKFNNRDYGDVLYRGECKLHETLLPSLFRSIKYLDSGTRGLNRLLKTIREDNYFPNELKLQEPLKYKECPDTNERHKRNKKILQQNNHRIEGILQHYGIKTRFIDVVDNQWVALWMGANKIVSIKQKNSYVSYQPRTIDLLDPYNVHASQNYQYLILIAMPHKMMNYCNGIWESDELIQIDLRQALPSTYLRPHAQHGIVIRKKDHLKTDVNEYDMASEVVGILKIKVDDAQKWLGGGALLTQDNLFPSPGHDYGYDCLLSRGDIFKDHPFLITRYM